MLAAMNIAGLIERTLCGGHDRGTALRRDKSFSKPYSVYVCLDGRPPIAPRRFLQKFEDGDD